MSEDDGGEDWFEQALADAKESDASGNDAGAQPDADDDWFPEGGDGENGEEAPGEPPVGDDEAMDALSNEGDADFESGGVSKADAVDVGGVEGESDDASDDGGSLFEDESEMDSLEDAAAETDDEGDGEGSLFDEDFGSALASAAGPGGEEAPSEDFEDDDFESEIPRIDLGIEGLDGMIQGGIPHRHLMVVIGAPGTGKTTFGLQFLHHGLQQGESVVFVTLEQSRESIIDTADERGWAFDRYEREDRLAIVDLDPVEMANSLENIRGEFPELVREFDADRLVLDSVSLLEMMYDDQSRRRTEVFDFTRSLKQAGVTTMLTSEASEENPYASRHGIIEYLTDAVFVLQYVRGDTQETRLAVEIQKIRNANHSRQTKPYAITLDGIDVYQQASIF